MIRYAQALVRAAARLGDATRWPSQYVAGVAPWIVPTYELGRDRGDTERRVFAGGTVVAGAGGQFATWGLQHVTRELELVALSLLAAAETDVQLSTRVADFAALGVAGSVGVHLSTDPASGLAQPGAAIRAGNRLVLLGAEPQVSLGNSVPLWLPLEGLILPPARLLAVSFQAAGVGGTCGFFFRELGP